METILIVLKVMADFEITFRGSFAFFAIISVLYTLYRIIKKTIQGIQLDKKEKMVQEKN